MLRSLVTRSELPSLKLPLLTDSERLSLALRIQFRRHRTHNSRLETQLPKNATNLLNRQGRFIELEVNDVVIAIDLVPQARNGLELVVEFQDFLQLSDARSVNLKFDHIYFVRTPER